MEKKHLNVVCAVVHDGDNYAKDPSTLQNIGNFLVEKSKREKVITRHYVVNCLRRWIGTSMLGQNSAVLNMNIPTLRFGLLPTTAWLTTMTSSSSHILIPAG